MASKSGKRGDKTKPAKRSKQRSAKKKKQQGLDDASTIQLPTWDEVPSDDSLNDFIVDKNPAVNQRLLNHLFDSSDDDDDIKILTLEEEEEGAACSTTRKPSSAPSKLSVNISDILNFDENPPAKQPSIIKKKKKSINEIGDKLRASKGISEKERKERFVEHALKRIKVLDVRIINWVRQQNQSNNFCAENEQQRSNSPVAHCSSVDDDDIDLETGVVQLNPKEEEKMGILLCKLAVYTVRKGRALVVVNGTKSVVTECGEVRVKAGDEYSFKNLDEREQLVVHFCKIA